MARARQQQNPEAALTEPKISALAAIDALPAFPETLRQLLAAANDDNMSGSELARIVERDPPIAANLLRLANKAARRTSRPVDSIAQAIARVGMVQTRKVAIAAAFSAAMPKQFLVYRITSKTLWLHSIAVAVLAEETAHQKTIDAPLAYTAGLLHDIGMVAMELLAHRSPELLNALASEEISVEEAELLIAGMDHSELSSALANAWGFPPALCSALQWHHAPDRAPAGDRGLVDVVHAADTYAHFAGLSARRDEQATNPDSRVTKRLSLTVDTFKTVMFASLDPILELRELSFA